MPAPANDLFANAILLASGGGSLTGLTCVDAGTEANEPSYYYSNAQSVWFKFTPTVTGQYDFLMSGITAAPGGNPYSFMDMYQGTVITALAFQQSQFYYGGEPSFHLDLILQAGVTYHLRVYSTNNTPANNLTTPNFNLAWSYVSAEGNPPANDDITDAITLAGPAGSVSGTTESSTTQDADEIAWFNYQYARSVWYKFEVVVPTLFTIGIEKTGGDAAYIPYLEMYKALVDNPTAFAELDFFDASGDGTDTPTPTDIVLAPGKYYISIQNWSYDSAKGTFDLTWSSQELSADNLWNFSGISFEFFTGATNSTATSVDLGSGSVVFGETVTENLTGLAFKKNKSLYAVGTASAFGSPSQLYTVNKETGIATLIGSTGLLIYDIDFDSAGVLYGWDDDLVTINLSTGLATYVSAGASGLSSSDGAMAIDPITNKVWVISGSNLYEIHKTNGTIISTTPLTGRPRNNLFVGATFGENELLATLGLSTSGGYFPALICSINLSTGAVTQRYDQLVFGARGIAWLSGKFVTGVATHSLIEDSDILTNVATGSPSELPGWDELTSTQTNAAHVLDDAEVVTNSGSSTQSHLSAEAEGPTNAGTGSPLEAPGSELARNIGTGSPSAIHGEPNTLGNSATASPSLVTQAKMADIVAPNLQTVSGNGNSVYVNYDEVLVTPLPATTAFTVGVNGVIRTVTTVSRTNSILTLTISGAALAPGDSISVWYQVPASNPIRDAAGNISTEQVRNGSYNGSAPTAQFNGGTSQSYGPRGLSAGGVKIRAT